MGTQPLDVRDEIRRCVLANLARGLAAARPALIMQHDQPLPGIEVLHQPRIATEPRPAVQHDHRPAVRIAVQLVVNPVQLAYPAGGRTGMVR